MRLLQLGVVAALVSVAAPARAEEAPLAVEYVIGGQEVWVGNDTFEAYDSPARYPGTLEDLKKAVGSAYERLDRATRAGLVIYDDRPAIRVPLGPLSDVDAAALGSQRDYYGRVGSNLGAGISVGLDELRRAKAQRKLLVVIGDGADAQLDTARIRMKTLAERAASEGVMVRAVIVKGALSTEESPVCYLDPACLTHRSEELPAALHTVLSEAMQQPPRVTPAPPVATQGAEETSCWLSSTWIQLLAGSGLVGLVALTLWLSGRRGPRAASGG